MASLSGVSSSNMTSSLYNSANIISGLASGLDTEGMIESLVQSYQTKINSLNQKVTKTEWKQDAYRSIITKLVGFSSKYTSYTSSTNLMSPSFFNSAVKVTTAGTHADKVSASGKTSSDIALNAVHQLATSAQLRTSSNLISGDGISIEAAEAMDMNGKTTLGTLNGSLSIAYGSNTVSVSFDEVADVKAMEEIRSKLRAEGKSASDADVLAGLINQKLEGQQISFTSGTVDTAENRIGVTVKNGTISFADKSTGGNTVYISGASGNVAKTLGLELDNANEDKPASFTVGYDTSLTKQVDNSTYLSGKTMNLSLDGTVKQIKMPQVFSSTTGDKILDADGNELDYTADNYAAAVNTAVQKAFKGKVNVTNAATDGKLSLRFEVQEGSDLVINTDVGETLGIGRTATTYLNTSKTLGELLGEDKLANLTPALKRDSQGALVTDKNGNYVVDTDEKGNPKYAFTINDVVIGNYSKETKLSDILSDINGNDDAGVRVSYSQTTKNFLFSSKETGADSEVKLGGGLAEAMFGGGGVSTEKLGEQKLSDLLSDNSYQLENSSVKGEEFALTVNGTKYTYQFGGSNPTVQQVLSAVNAAKDASGKSLSAAGMTAELNDNGELVVKDKNTGAAASVNYEEGSLAKKFTDEIKARVEDYAIDRDALYATHIKDAVSEDIAGKDLSFTVDGKTYTYRFTGNNPTMQQLLGGFNAAVDKSSGKSLGASGMQAHFDENGELVISKTATGERVAMSYGEGTVAETIVDGVKAYSESRRLESLEELKGSGVTEILTSKTGVGGSKFSLTVDGNEYSVELTDDDLSVDEMLDQINSAQRADGKSLSDFGMKASFNERGDLVITAADGSQKTDVGSNAAAQKILDGVKAYASDATNQAGYTKGQDAEFTVTVNGEQIRMNRSSNSVNIDGLTVTMKELFDTATAATDEKGNVIKDADGNEQMIYRASDAVTFKSSVDADKIVDAVKSMINDYNTMMAEIKSAYSTLPYQKSDGTFGDYEPLTDDDRAGMSESAIERYEEKAKQGILFGDRNLSNLYTKMRDVFSPAGNDGALLRAMGITTSYSISDGAEAVTLDEDKLRAMLESDPDKVTEVFTKTTGNGGVMQNMKVLLDNYSKTTGEPKGILIQQAGSPLSSLSLMNNTWQKEIDSINTQIEKWQDKLSSQVDRYTQQFSRLEVLINQMNSQSSTLAGLMGG